MVQQSVRLLELLFIELLQCKALEHLFLTAHLCILSTKRTYSRSVSGVVTEVTYIHRLSSGREANVMFKGFMKAKDSYSLCDLFDNQLL